MAHELKQPLEFELAVEMLEALGVPKETNVTSMVLKLNFNSRPMIQVSYNYHPEPFSVDDEGNILSILKKYKLVPIEGEK